MSCKADGVHHVAPWGMVELFGPPKQLSEYLGKVYLYDEVARYPWGSVRHKSPMCYASLTVFFFLFNHFSFYISAEVCDVQFMTALLRSE